MKIFLFILLAFSLFSCNKKTNSVKPDISNITTCFEQNNWNIQKINANLLGSWQMNRAFGGWAGESAVENVKLIFLKSDSLAAFKNGVLFLACKYHIDSTGNTYYSVASDSFCHYTSGRLMFCANEIVFNSSFVDGIDYYFAKTGN
jgi:hypothetical protein